MRTLFLLAVVMLSTVLAATNPDERSHRQVVSSALAGEAAPRGLLARFTGDVLGNFVVLEYHNYYVCSTTTHRGKLASVGFCARVWKL